MTKNELATMAELALMGYLVPTTSDEEVKFILDRIQSAAAPEELDKEEMFSEIMRYIDTSEYSVYGISCSTVFDMPCINVVFRELADKNFKVDNEEGVFCYCLNMGDSMCSEYGYSFFEKRGRFYHRVA